MCELTGQLTWSDLAGWSGKTSPEHSAPTEAKISAPSSKKRQGSQKKMPLFLDLREVNGLWQDASWETDLASLGALMTHSIMASHSAEDAYVYLLISADFPPRKFCLNCGEKPLMPKPSKLSDILEENADPKYSLSARACQGILNRAERRGKELPKELKEALTEQARA